MNKPAPILGVEVTGIGIGLPRESLTNQQYIDRCGPIYNEDKSGKKVLVSAEDIESLTGVKGRYICAKDETLPDLVTAASLDALNDAGLPLGTKIGKLLLGTATSHKFRETPNTQIAVQVMLTEKGYPIHTSGQSDVACASFVYQWIDAYRHFHTGELDNALVAGGDTVSRMVRTSYADTLMMTDGAGSIVLERSKNPASESGVLSFYEVSDGTYQNQLVAEVGEPLEMRDGFELYRKSAEAMIAGTEIVLDWAGVTLDQVAIVVPHQASGRIIETVRKRLRVPHDKMVITVDKYGNTSSGCVPMALHQAHRGGRVNRGDLVLATSVGTGLNTEVALVRW